MTADADIFVIGAGPAGLTAAYCLTKETPSVIVIEKDPVYVGGISRTVEYKDFKFDIGGHRFFSKSDRVMQWWMELMPPADADAAITYQAVPPGCGFCIGRKGVANPNHIVFFCIGFSICAIGNRNAGQLYPAFQLKISTIMKMLHCPDSLFQDAK